MRLYVVKSGPYASVLVEPAAGLNRRERVLAGPFTGPQARRDASDFAQAVEELWRDLGRLDR